MRPRLALVGIVLAALGLPIVAFFGVFAVVLYENGSIRPGMPAALLVHPALRRVEPVAQCSPLLLGRRFQECGGICGEIQTVEFGTRASEAELRKVYDIDALRIEMGFDEIDLFLMSPRPGTDPDCPSAVIYAYDDFETS